MLAVACGQLPESQREDAPVPSEFFSRSWPHDNPDFANEMQATLAKSADRNTVWGVDIHVFGPFGGNILLYSQNGTTPVRPASTMKLFTTWLYFHMYPDVLRGGARADQLKNMLKESDNDAAEGFLRQATSVAGGKEKVMQLFREHHIDDLLQVDGSGLSYDNKVSAFSLVRALTTIRQGEYFASFQRLLPIGGVDGTLSGRSRLTERACGAKITAKTGTLTTDPLTALAGYAELDNGWHMTFAFLGDSIRDMTSGKNSLDTALCRAVSEAQTQYARVRAQ